MSTTIAGAFSARIEAEQAVDNLIAAGFDRDGISLLLADSAKGQHFRVQETDRGAEGAVGGGIAGGALGALGAALAAVGVIAAPGVGLVAAGPIVAAFAGAGAGGVAGGLIGGLVGMGIPEHHAKILDEQVKNGGILVAVDYANDDQRDMAERILSSAGAAETSTTVS
ncbi:MAG: hypothetical protein ACE37F_08910 [Nannocystaceae bacterium]|nr:hypothetical protein [bacterium]